MKKLFWLKLKSQRYLFLLLLLVVVFQLIVAEASSYALAEREPPLNIAVQQSGDDVRFDELISGLTDIENFDSIMVDASLSPDAVFRQERVQALLVLPPDFWQNIESGKKATVSLYPAPGISNIDFAREQVANVILQIRAQHDLKVALENLGAIEFFDENSAGIDILDVVYEGPLLQNTSMGVMPVYGVSALLVMLAFLHAALTVPTREDKRIIIRGRKAYSLQFYASILVVWLVWLVIIALYFVFMSALVGKWPDPSVFFGFVSIMLYVSLLASLLAQFIGRHAASWMFLPMFLLGMTIGGGLWTNVTLPPYFSPLIPVTTVVTPGTAALPGTAVLFLACAIICLALVIRFRLSFRPTRQ